MHALVAQMALSANFRRGKNILQGITVGEVAEAIAKEDSGFVDDDIYEKVKAEVESQK